MARQGNGITLSWEAGALQFRFPFRIAHGMRTHTDVVMVTVQYEGFTGKGEATLPPYLPANINSTIAYFEQLPFHNLQAALEAPLLQQPLLEADTPATLLPAIAALDMAIWHIRAQRSGITVRHLLQLPEEDTALKSYTLAVCDRAEMEARLEHGRSLGFSFFKLKFDGVHDEQLLRDFSMLSDAPFAVDVNQGWKEVGYAKAMATKIADAGGVLIEQPFAKEDREMTRQLSEACSLPIIADEALQRLSDLPSVADAFSGVNVKLQKCGGITEAYHILQQARQKGLKTLMGCMSESRIGCEAAAALLPLCDWNDLDGQWLLM
ncbi:MAG: enolase C-terminal domain-like protein [Chitinophagales bacterium]